MDCEDCVAAVDAEDKVDVYRNWLGLMKGDARRRASTRAARPSIRALNPDRDLHRRPTAATLTLHGRALMLVRNVGHLMTTARSSTRRRSEIPEGILDAMFTVADRAARPRGRRARATAAPARSTSSSRRCTGRTRSPSPTSSSRRVEEVLGLPRDTLKMGIMDEERRTTRQPRRVHPRRARPRGRSSTPASSTAPATRSTPRWKPGRWSARAR